MQGQMKNWCGLWVSLAARISVWKTSQSETFMMLKSVSRKEVRLKGEPLFSSICMATAKLVRQGTMPLSSLSSENMFVKRHGSPPMTSRRKHSAGVSGSSKMVLMWCCMGTRAGSHCCPKQQKPLPGWSFSSIPLETTSRTAKLCTFLHASAGRTSTKRWLKRTKSLIRSLCPHLISIICGTNISVMFSFQR